jgi:hypothetical protein
LIKPNGSRLRAAIAALPFERPKFTAIAQLNKDDFAVVMERVLEATDKVINSRPMQVLEAPKVVDAGETCAG